MLRFIRALSLIVVLLFVASLMVWLHGSHGSYSEKEAVSPQDKNLYTLGNFTIDIIQNQTAIISSQGISVTVDPVPYYYSGGKFVSENLTSGKVNRIDNQYQNTVGVIDQFTHAKITFVYALDQSQIDITVVNAGGSAYLSMNFSTGRPYYADAGGVFFDGGQFDSANFGHNVLGSGIASFDESLLTGDLTISWSQFTYQNEFDYGVFNAGSSQSSLFLMYGPLGNVGSATDFGPISVSMS